MGVAWLIVEDQMFGKFAVGSVLRVTGQTMLLAGMIAGASAFAQNTVPDAQVESSVLKALAGAPDLANEAITTRTVYGTVTLTGSVSSENARQEAENLAANAAGVKKVIDELRLGSANANAAGPGTPNGGGSGAPMVLQSDGTYAAAAADASAPNAGPAPGSAPAAMAQRNDPDNDQALDQQAEQANNPQAGANNTQPNQMPAPSTQPMTANGQPGYPAPQHGQQPYGQQPYGRRPMNGYPPPAYGGYSSSNQPPVYGGQVGGESVTVPTGALLRVRLNHSVSSDRSAIGSTFDGVLINDVVAGGAVAIPRGAMVQGKVVDAKGSGTFKGRGELSIQLTQVTLAGKVYPVTSDLWAHHGGDKTTETIDKTAGFGAVGALIGAAGGGGVGAAVGGGVGAALGLGSSAASGRGQVFIPAEGVVTFHLAQDAPVTTVSEAEMQRLAYGAGPNSGDERNLRRPARVYVQPGYAYPYGYPYGYPGPYYGYPR